MRNVPERAIRAHRHAEAMKLLATLPDAIDRKTTILAFVQKLHDKDKLSGLIEANESGVIANSEIAIPLLYAYLDANAPMRTRGLVEFFRKAKTEFGGPIHERNDPLPEPPATLYRGAVEKGARGISWSTRREVAQGFADRCGGAVYQFKLTTVEAILGSMSKTGEYEVFVDPAYLEVVDKA